MPYPWCALGTGNRGVRRVGVELERQIFSARLARAVCSVRQAATAHLREGTRPPSKTLGLLVLRAHETMQTGFHI